MDRARGPLTYRQRRLGGKTIENRTNLSVGTDKRNWATEQQLKGTLQPEHYQPEWQGLHKELVKVERKSNFFMDNQGTHRGFQREVDHMKDHYQDGSHRVWGNRTRSCRNRRASVTEDRAKHFDYGFESTPYTPTTKSTMVNHPAIKEPEVFAGKSPQWISPASREMKTTHFTLGTDSERLMTTTKRVHNAANYDVPRAAAAKPLQSAATADSWSPVKAGQVLGLHSSVQLGTDSWDAKTMSQATYEAPRTVILASQSRRPRGNCAISKRAV